MLGREFDREIEKFVENELLEEMKKELIKERTRQRIGLELNICLGAWFAISTGVCIHLIKKINNK